MWGRGTGGNHRSLGWEGGENDGRRILVRGRCDGSPTHDCTECLASGRSLGCRAAFNGPLVGVLGKGAPELQHEPVDDAMEVDPVVEPYGGGAAEREPLHV